MGMNPEMAFLYVNLLKYYKNDTSAFLSLVSEEFATTTWGFETSRGYVSAPKIQEFLIKYKRK